MPWPTRAGRCGRLPGSTTQPPIHGTRGRNSCRTVVTSSTRSWRSTVPAQASSPAASTRPAVSGCWTPRPRPSHHPATSCTCSTTCSWPRPSTSSGWRSADGPFCWPEACRRRRSPKAMSCPDSRELLAFREAAGHQQLMQVDRFGEERGGTIDTPVALSNIRLSPDGRSLLATGSFTGAPGVWLVDLARRQQTRLSADGLASVWSPDGRHIAFTTRGGRDLFVQSARRQRRARRRDRLVPQDRERLVAGRPADDLHADRSRDEPRPLDHSGLGRHADPAPEDGVQRGAGAALSRRPLARLRHRPTEPARSGCGGTRRWTSRGRSRSAVGQPQWRSISRSSSTCRQITR